MECTNRVVAYPPLVEGVRDVIVRTNLLRIK